MRRLAWIAALALSASPAPAQDWATPEVCAIQPGPVDDAVFEPPGRDALEAVAAEIPNSLGKFWRITAPDGGVSHLWGTWHSADPLILDLPAEVRAAIEAATTVAVEIDFIPKSRDAYRDWQYGEGRYREPSDPFAFANADDGRIAGLSPEISDWVRDRAIELGWTEDVTLILSSGGLAEMLLSDPCEDFASGVFPIQDDYIHLLGRLGGAEILGLEEPEQFLEDLAGAADASAEAIIAVYAAYLKPVNSNVVRSANFNLYREGRLGLLAAWDAAFLEQVLGPRGPVALRQTDDYLLAFRNRRFMTRLEPVLADGGVFIAVGAGHLPGETGLVSLLRDAGHVVTRVPVPGEAE